MHPLPRLRQGGLRATVCAVTDTPNVASAGWEGLTRHAAHPLTSGDAIAERERCLAIVSEYTFPSTAQAPGPVVAAIIKARISGLPFQAPFGYPARG